jgi:hypothetical protein
MHRLLYSVAQPGTSTVLDHTSHCPATHILHNTFHTGGQVPGVPALCAGTPARMVQLLYDSRWRGSSQRSISVWPHPQQAVMHLSHRGQAQHKEMGLVSAE